MFSNVVNILKKFQLTNNNYCFQPTIYYKACHDKTWTYTGMKPTLEVCCKNKEVIPCN